MLKQPDTRDKLLPLRRFSSKELYSTAYLSLLVQRQKLKAKRIGRNYFTSEKWFIEYLERHARDDLRLKYHNFLYKEEKAHTKKLANSASMNLSGKTEAGKAGFFVWLKVYYIRILGVGSAMAIIFLLVGQLLIFTDSRQGRVAGGEEAGFEQGEGSSTQEWLGE